MTIVMEKWLHAFAVLSALAAAVSWMAVAAVHIPELNLALISLSDNSAEKFNAAISSAAQWNSIAAALTGLSAFCVGLGLLFRPGRDAVSHRNKHNERDAHWHHTRRV